jgi:hypothetical protein
MLVQIGEGGLGNGIERTGRRTGVLVRRAALVGGRRGLGVFSAGRGPHPEPEVGQEADRQAPGDERDAARDEKVVPVQEAGAGEGAVKKGGL